MGRKAGKSALLGAAVAGLISLISEYVSGKEEDAGPQRRKKDEDEEEKETMTEFICNATKDMIAENIPVEAIRDVRPKSYMYAFGLLSLLAMIICFLYYMYTVYQRSINQKFISLSSSSGDCVVVTKSVTGTFLGDSYGNWIGEDGFSYSQAKYELILTRAEWSKEDYAGIMLVALDQIRDLANAGQTMDFAANLAALTSWQLTCNATKYAVCEKFAGQSFVFTASAQYAFQVSHLRASLSNVGFDCTMPTTTSYDLPSSLYTIEFDYGDFVVNPTCNTTVSAKFLGYTPFLGAQSFRVVMDSRSFADAVGINNGYLSIVSLAEVKDVDGASINFTYRGYTYAGNYYVDPYYVGMRPLYCIRNLDSEAEINSDPPLPLLTADGNGVHQLCFMAVGSGLLAIPAMVHYGAAPLTPKPCFWYVKDSLAILLIGSFSSDMYGHEEACSEFNIVSTLIFYNVRTSNSLQIQAQDIAQQLILLLETVLRNNGYRTLTRNVYNASFASAASAYKPFTDSIVDDDQWREDAYSFCFKNCSVLTINSFGKTITDKALTEYMYQFNDGSCSDVYGLTVQGAVNLIRNPPTDFVERYYECAMAPQDALNDAIGIASGNATTLVPIAFMVLLPFLYIWLDITGHSKMKDEFTEEDREDMQNRLVTQLLRVRDGKVRAIPEASPVFQLSTELERLKTVQGGYPDSDDSDDEPEPLPGTSKPNHLPRASTSASTQSVVAVPYDNYLQAKL